MTAVVERGLVQRKGKEKKEQRLPLNVCRPFPLRRIVVAYDLHEREKKEEKWAKEQIGNMWTAKGPCRDVSVGILDFWSN